jgi:hypothetical protein
MNQTAKTGCVAAARCANNLTPQPAAVLELETALAKMNRKKLAYAGKLFARVSLAALKFL